MPGPSTPGQAGLTKKQLATKAPARKVAPNAFAANPTLTLPSAAADSSSAPVPGTVQDSLSVFGTVVGATAPAGLHRSTVARTQIRRLITLR